MSDTPKEVESEVIAAVEKVLEEEAKAEVAAEVKEPVPEVAPSPAETADPVGVVAPIPAEVADPVGIVAPAVDVTPSKETKVPEEPESDQPIEAPVTETVEKVVDQFENMTIFGNKSLDELHKIQSKKSHLSAGILFTDPSLRM
jgi:hypothetical protein